LCLRLGGTGQILDPPELAEAVFDDAASALAAYAEDVRAVAAG
jgi:hypothetical protein